MRVGDTEIPIQSLRRRYKELQAQNPITENSKMEAEFSVSHFVCVSVGYQTGGWGWGRGRGGDAAVFFGGVW